MKIHEYQAYKMFGDAGIPVPVWRLAGSPDEAAAAFDMLQSSVAVIKAQVHAGGRGIGGGIKLVRSRDQARDAAAGIFAKPLKTLQTSPEGKKVYKVMVAQALDIRWELYAGVVVDRARGLPVLMASAEGGIEIEEVAAHTPHLILVEPVDPSGLKDFQGRKLTFGMGLQDGVAQQAGEIFRKLCDIFTKNDCSLVEINPLVVTSDEEVVALDAKINFDDNAAFRHPEWEALRDPTEENSTESEAQNAGISYIQLDGNIGCLVNGAGLAMATMDVIQQHGGAPANFLDVGGGANKEQVTQAFRLILADPRVKAVHKNSPTH